MFKSNAYIWGWRRRAPNLTFPKFRWYTMYHGWKHQDALTYERASLYLPVRHPSIDEVNNTELRFVSLKFPHGGDPYGVDCFTPLSGLRSVSNVLSYIFCSIMNLNVRQRNAINQEYFMSCWGIGKETANKTLASTFKEYTRSTNNLTRRLKTGQVHSRYQHLSGPYIQFIRIYYFKNYFC